MEKWICSRCEAENEADAAVCAVCGTKREFVQQTTGPRQMQKSSQYSRDPKPISSGTFGASNKSAVEAGSKDELRDLIKKYDKMKLLYRVLIVAFVALQYILFALKYSPVTYKVYTIYNNCTGANDGAEQICSIILVIIAVFPAVLCWFDFRLRKRNLPITVSAFVTALTAIYCCTIWFGSENSTVVPALIILSSSAVLVFSVLLVKTINKLDNAMYRPKGF